MAVLAHQTLVGTVGRIYELRTVGKDNREVVDFSVAVTPRKREGDEWVDGETYWMTVTAWNRLAKNVAESLRAGDRVIVYGRTDMKPGYTNKDGVDMPARPFIVADFVGLELSNDAAHSDRQNRRDGGGSSNASSSSAPARTKSKPAPAEVDDLEIDFDDDDDLAF